VSPSRVATRIPSGIRHRPPVGDDGTPELKLIIVDEVTAHQFGKWSRKPASGPLGAEHA